MANINPNGNSNVDMDRIFSGADSILNTSRNVYNDIANGFNGLKQQADSSRRNMGSGYSIPTQQQSMYPTYGYGYYDDYQTASMTMVGNMATQSDFYPGISNPAYGKGGY